MATVNQHRVLIKDLSTRTVTLYPSCARIVRTIPNLSLTPGANEIEIHGLAPTIDDQSVQFEGHGSSASITDMAVELVDNREIFEDVYPESDDEDAESEEDDDEVEESAEYNSLKEELASLKSESEVLTELQSTANDRLQMCESFLRGTVQRAEIKGGEFTDLLERYQSERMAQFRVHKDATAKLDTICTKMAKVENDLYKAGREARRKRRELEKERAKKNLAKQRQKEERDKEKEKIKEERVKFWPKQVYRIVLRLDVPTRTPGSSRRGSVGSATVTSQKDVDGTADSAMADSIPLTLTLSYVTKEACWTPNHEIIISSLNKTATICYRAEFTNGTSETWTDAKVSLCSSQTSYSGLEDSPPTLQPWQLKLLRGNQVADRPILSRQEAFGSNAVKPSAAKVNRDNVFGVKSRARRAAPSAARPATKQQAETLRSSLSVPWKRQSSAASFGRSRMLGATSEEVEEEDMQEEMGFGLFDETGSPGYSPASPLYSPTTPPPPPQMGYDESAWEDNGLTSTYDLPNTRTLAPSSIARRYTIATLQASAVHLSHVAIPKLRAAAFLRASFRNPSASITLLAGALSITLDGSFLGTTRLSRTGPSQNIVLSLGVDPAVHISYKRSAPKRSTAGGSVLFLSNKETALRFTREIWVTNTRPAPIEIRVTDQVPESLDERLRVDVLHPAGLEPEGRAIATGAPAKTDDAAAPTGAAGVLTAMSGRSQAKAWGKATATMSKAGEVVWQVVLDKGNAGLLTLAYEARLPPQEMIVEN